MSDPLLSQPPEPRIHRLIRGVDPAFNAIETALVTFSAVSIASYYVLEGKSPISEGDYCTLETSLFPVEVRIPLGGPLHAALAGKRPDQIDIDIVGRSDHPPQYPHETDGFKNALMNAVCPAFVLIYAEHETRLKDVLGRRNTWPSFFEFCANIRNALSHGGAASKVQSCQWRGYSVAPDTHRDKMVIGSEISLADLILLMLDFGDEVAKLGASPETSP